MSRMIKSFLAFVFVSLVVSILILSQSQFLNKGKSKPIVILERTAPCDNLKSVCKFTGDGKQLELVFSGKVKTMQAFRLNAGLLNFVTEIENISASFSMTSMSMGINRFVLQPHDTQARNSYWQTSVLLPVCISKRSDWLMVFKVETATKTYKASIPLEIE